MEFARSQYEIAWRSLRQKQGVLAAQAARDSAAVDIRLAYGADGFVSHAVLSARPAAFELALADAYENMSAWYQWFRSQLAPVVPLCFASRLHEPGEAIAIKTYPKETTEVIERDERGEMVRVTRTVTKE
jgi:hypothetical protein